MAAANAVGDKIPMFVIRKAQKPRCFKNVKFLLCRNQHKKRLDGWVLFESWKLFWNRQYLHGHEEVMDASDGLEEESMECPRKSDLLIALEGLQKRSLVSTNGSTVQADSLKI